MEREDDLFWKASWSRLGRGNGYSKPDFGLGNQKYSRVSATTFQKNVARGSNHASRSFGIGRRL